MARPRKPTPSYHPHPTSERGRAVWTDAGGVRRFRTLPGRFGSAESKAAYGRLVLELQAGSPPPAADGRDGLTVAEVLLAFLTHADRHYRDPDGRPTSELTECKLVARKLRELYADTPAAAFGPLKLRAVREGWVADGLARSEVNRRAGIVRRLFRWAVGHELVAPAVHQALAAVAGLQRGRTAARETEPVRPVADADVRATLPHLNRHARGLAEFQRLTGCRPGEACRVRMCEVDASGPVWVYRPPAHKTAHRGRTRAVAIGPRAQALLREFLTGDPSDYLFSPRRAVDEVRAARAAARATPHYPSHVRRNATKRVAAPKRRPAERYSASSYQHAIDRACDRAFPPPVRLARRPGESRAARQTPAERAELAAWRAAHRWHANQLRHAFATRIRREHGLEAAQVLLGHARADVTQVYAARDEGLAAAVIVAVG